MWTCALTGLKNEVYLPCVWCTNGDIKGDTSVDTNGDTNNDTDGETNDETNGDTNSDTKGNTNYLMHIDCV